MISLSTKLRTVDRISVWTSVRSAVWARRVIGCSSGRRCLQLPASMDEFGGSLAVALVTARAPVRATGRGWGVTRWAAPSIPGTAVPRRGQERPVTTLSTEEHAIVAAVRDFVDRDVR